MPNQNHEFLSGKYPHTINPGGPNHEELVSLIGIYEYFDNLYNYHFKDKELNHLKKINKINKLISEYEESIANPLLDYISKRNNFKLIGKNKIKNKDRSPTISFTIENKSSKKVSKILVKNNIATRNDHFYAWRCLEALGIDTNDGVVRISMTHYNNKKDVDNLINALELI